jgi:hypothetical protein
MVCTGCGIVGADARPNWKDRTSRRSLTATQWELIQRPAKLRKEG